MQPSTNVQHGPYYRRLLWKICDVIYMKSITLNTNLSFHLSLFVSYFVCLHMGQIFLEGMDDSRASDFMLYYCCHSWYLNNPDLVLRSEVGWLLMGSECLCESIFAWLCKSYVKKSSFTYTDIWPNWGKTLNCQKWQKWVLILQKACNPE